METMMPFLWIIGQAILFTASFVYRLSYYSIFLGTKVTFLLISLGLTLYASSKKRSAQKLSTRPTDSVLPVQDEHERILFAQWKNERILEMSRDA